MAITAKTSVITADGWRYAKDIRVGDWVFNRLGKPVRVTSVQQFRSEDCYQIIFDDKTGVEGDAHLSFATEDKQYRKHIDAYKGMQKFRRPLKPLSVTEMLEVGLRFRGNRRFLSVPTTEPIQFPHQPLGIPPAIYGFWFVARTSHKYMAVPKQNSEEIYELFRNNGYIVEKKRKKHPIVEYFTTVPSIWDQTRGEKTHNLPDRYMYGSPEQRSELIYGMLSARRAVTDLKVKKIIIYGNDKRKMTAIQQIAESLGAKTRLFVNSRHKEITLSIARNTPVYGMLPRKRVHVHEARRFVEAIEPIPAQLCVHIETEEKSDGFLVNGGFIPCL